MTKKTKVFVIAGVALAGIGVGAYFLLKKDKVTTNGDDTTTTPKDTTGPIKVVTTPVGDVKQVKVTPRT